MKKVTEWLLLLSLAVFLWGCGGGEAKEAEATREPEQNREQETVESAKVMSDHVLNNSYHLDRTVQGVTDAYAVPGFWLRETEDADRLLMTEEEIAAYNARIAADHRYKVVDLTTSGETVRAEEVRELIECYDFGNYHYLDGDDLTCEKKIKLLKKCNLAALDGKDEIPVTYGLVASPADVRAFPAEATLMDRADDWEFDYFQESKLKVGEGVRIYHATEDGEWLFVQARNYAGWVRNGCIAKCAKEEMTEYLAAKAFVVITKPETVRVRDNDIHFAMGCRLAKDGEQTIRVPVSENGSLNFETLSLETLEYHDGYLPYTTALVLDQAMKLLNIGYGWGSKDDLLDCSSAMLSVYECFGFSLPRNTSEMAQCLERRIDVGEMGEEEKREILKNVLPGSMLIMRGHVMMYLGIKEDVVYALHAFTKYYNDDGGKENVMQCTITPLTIKKANGSSYLDAVHTVWEVLPGGDHV